MTILYNLQTDGDEYRINKWTDGNIESSYHVGREGCTCPAGHRHSCRHRQMIGNLILIVNSHYFWDYDRGIAVDINGVPKSYYDTALRTPAFETTELVAPRCTPGLDSAPEYLEGLSQSVKQDITSPQPAPFVRRI